MSPTLASGFLPTEPPGKGNSKLTSSCHGIVSLDFSVKTAVFFLCALFGTFISKRVGLECLDLRAHTDLGGESMDYLCAGSYILGTL